MMDHTVAEPVLSGALGPSVTWSPEPCVIGARVAAVGSGARRWSVLHVKSRQEKAVAAVLAEVEIPFFLPLVTRVRFYGHRRRVVESPLFPSYVFVRGTPEEAFFAVATRRVARVIPVGDQERMDSEVRHIREVLMGGGALELSPFLNRGTPVRVTAGPFKGVEGLVEERRPWDRLILQVHTLGRAASLEIDASLLERVD